MLNEFNIGVMDRDLYFVVLFIIYGDYFLMRVRSREHFGGELDSILYCIHLCFAGAESLVS